MIETHCRACGVYKLEYCLNKCDYCCCYFCGLHFIISEDKCDGCYGIRYDEIFTTKRNKMAILDNGVSDRKVTVIYGIRNKDKKPVMMKYND